LFDWLIFVLFLYLFILKKYSKINLKSKKNIKIDFWVKKPGKMPKDAK